MARGEVLENEYLELIKEELNVKEVVLEPSSSNLEPSIELDTEITPELKTEGNYRELVRAVQDLRKKMGLTPNDRVSITLSPVAESLVSSFMDDFKKTVLADSVTFSENDGEEVKVDTLVYKVSISK